MRFFGPVLVLAAVLAGCGATGPRDFTCADVTASSEKTKQLAQEVLKGVGEDTSDKLDVAIERANQTCGPGGGSKAEDKPYKLLVDLLKVEFHASEANAESDPDQEAQDDAAQLDQLPGMVKRYCAEAIGKGSPAPFYKQSLARAVRQLERASENGQTVRDVALRALNAFDRWHGRCAPALRARVLAAGRNG